MRYTEIEPLASGGMGTVALCVGEGAEGFRRIYARKRIHAEFASHPEFREMFVQEAKLAAAVRHANVVSVLDVGEDSDGVYLVMEYIEGVSLAMMLATLAKQERRLPLQVAIRVLRDVAAGLSAIHSATDEHGRPLEIVHRDISPQNVLVGFDGVARVADFGVAKAAHLSGHTASGVLKGKLGYAAPEQLRFEPVDLRCDLFGFGVVCWETLTGSRLYAGREGARAILSEPPPDLANERDVPDELAALLFWLLAKEPAARPESAEPVIETLERTLAALIAEEGAFDVKSFVRTHFEESRKERSERIRTKLECLDRSMDPDVAASGARRHESPSDVDRASTIPERLRPLRDLRFERSSPRWKLGLFALVAVVVLLGILGVFAFDASPSVPSPPASSPVDVAPASTRARSDFDASPEGVTGSNQNDPDRGLNVDDSSAMAREPSSNASTEPDSVRSLAPRRTGTGPTNRRREGRGVVVDMTAAWDWDGEN